MLSKSTKLDDITRHLELCDDGYTFQGVPCKRRTEVLVTLAFPANFNDLSIQFLKFQISYSWFGGVGKICITPGNLS